MGVGDADAVCSRLMPFRSFGGLPAARSDRPRRQVRQLGGVLRQAIPAQMWLVPAQMWLWSRRRRGWFPAPICAVRSLSAPMWASASPPCNFNATGPARPRQ